VGDGFVYASLVTDAFSRKIVGWSLAKTLSADGPIKALRMALRERGRRKRPLIHHSDQGVQYCCERYVKILKSHLATISMSKKGAPYENGKAERVNGILKHEFGLVATFSNFRHAKIALREAIWLYNNERPHLALGYKIPAEVHRQSLNQLN
jgi:transposase InsO family protein